MRYRARPHENHVTDARSVWRLQLESSAISQGFGRYSRDRRPRRRTAVSVEQISRRVDLAVLFVGASGGVAAGNQDSSIGQQQRIRVIETRIDIGGTGGERVCRGIVKVGVEAG